MTGWGRIWAVGALLVMTACSTASDASAPPSTAVTSTTTSTTTSSSTTSTTAPAPEVAGVMVESDVGPAPSTGCSRPATTTARTAVRFERKLPHGGVERSYLLDVPPAHDGRTPVPLVLDLHGLFIPPQVHAQLTGFSAVGAIEGFVTVTPRGGTGPVPQWERDEVAFLDALLDTVTAELCVDEGRLFLSGMSNGALMASTLVCTSPARFAAVAPVAGIATPPDCAAGPTPVMTFHGTSDQQVLFGGGLGTGTELPDPLGLGDRDVPERVASWAARNGCLGEFRDTRVGADVVRRDYAGCPDDSQAIFYVVEGGAHAWPGSALSEELEPLVGPSTTTVDATELIWDFFASRRGTREVS